MIDLPHWLEVISLPMPATLGAVNVHLIRGPAGVALIDTGMDDAESRAELDRQLAARGLALGDIDTVVATHHHADHAGLGSTFARAGARTMMSTVDARSLALFLDHPELDEERANFHGRHAIPDEFRERVATIFPFFRKLTERFEPAATLEDGAEIDLGGIRFRVIATPGHTPGHICLLHEGERLVLTGDHVIAADATHISTRPEVRGEDMLGAFLSSLARIRDLPPCRGLPGHGEPIAALGPRATRIIEHHRRRLEEVEGALADAPRGAHDLSAEVMGPRPKVFSRWLAMSQTMAYLEHLMLHGRAREEQLAGGVVGYRISRDRG